MKPLNQDGLLEKEHNTCVFGYQEHLEERRRKRNRMREKERKEGKKGK